MPNQSFLWKQYQPAPRSIKMPKNGKWEQRLGQEISPSQPGRSRVPGPASAWAVAELTPEREGQPQLGQELPREGNEPFPVLEVTHTHCPWRTWREGTAKPEGAALMESCYQQVICSGSNYLNIFTGDEGNEGARKRGMGGKSSFSNCNELIKKIQETRTLLCTVSLPLPPTGFISFYKGALGRLFIFDHSGINLQMYKLPLNPCLPTVKLHITPWFLKASGRCKLETKRRGMISVRHCRDCLKRAAGPHPD